MYMHMYFHGRLSYQAPLRLYVPHQPVPDAGDDLVAKIIVEQGDWTMTKTIPLPSKPLTDEVSYRETLYSYNTEFK